jgi:acyl-coenzyme A thioesterase PaaI-like protein
MPAPVPNVPRVPLPTEGVQGDGILRRLYPNSFGSGLENADGLRILFRRSGDVITSKITLDRRFEGTPGVAHGGIVGAILDDAGASVMLVTGKRSVTAQLDVTYRAPVRVGRPLTVVSWLESVEGRKHRIYGQVSDGGDVVAYARSLFVEVDPEHFDRVRDA